MSSYVYSTNKPNFFDKSDSDCRNVISFVYFILAFDYALIAKTKDKKIVSTA